MMRLLVANLCPVFLLSQSCPTRSRDCSMDAKTSPPNTATSPDVSFVRGGPFYRIQRAVGLIRPNQWNPGRRIALYIAVGWLPLFLLTALLNPEGMLSLVKDYRVHSRILVAVPALLIAEILMEVR